MRKTLIRDGIYLTGRDLDLRILRRTVNSVTLQEIISETAVEEIIYLARDKAEDELEYLYESIWLKSLAKSRVSQRSAQAVTGFLASLSTHKQYTASGSIRIWDVRLWQDMPILRSIVDRFWNNLDLPQTAPARKIGITNFLECVYFTSLLFRSGQPAFAGYSMFLLWSFREGLEWPVNQFKRSRTEYEDDATQYEAFDIWVPAMAIQMKAAGPELMDTISREPRIGTRDRLTLGRWRFWQQRLLKIAADRKIDLDIRQMAAWTSDRVKL